MNNQINNIKNLIKNYTIETTPKVYQQIEDLKVLLTPNTNIYITYLPDEDPKNIVNTAKKIKDEGFEPIPHLPARSIKDFDKESDDYFENVQNNFGSPYCRWKTGSL